MKRIIVKRLIYKNSNEEIIYYHDYDGELTDENILGAIHELGKTVWIGKSLWMLQNGRPHYEISVGTFYQYQKSWYNLFWDWVRRII